MKVWPIALGCLLLSNGAYAQSASPAEGALREACAGDFKKLCSDVRPGGGRVVQCLNSHHDQLTTACQEALRSAHDEAAAKAGAQNPPAKP